jgi:hypothetical protein
MGANNGTGDSYSKYTILEHSLFFVIIHVVLLFCNIVLQNCVKKIQLKINTTKLIEFKVCSLYCGNGKYDSIFRKFVHINGFISNSKSIFMVKAGRLTTNNIPLFQGYFRLILCNRIILDDKSLRHKNL